MELGRVSCKGRDGKGCEWSNVTGRREEVRMWVKNFELVLNEEDFR